jgi:preprotein translocase subunit SecB
MEVKNQPKLLFHGADIIDINFNAKQAYDGKEKIDLHINPQVFIPEDNLSIFQIIMEVEVTCKEYFSLNLVSVGNFELNGEIDADIRKKFINENAPAIMFPYVRSFITTLSSNLGTTTGPLVLPTQFFKGEIPEVKVEPTAEETTPPDQEIV